jgi:hypothetical protein
MAMAKQRGQTRTSSADDADANRPTRKDESPCCNLRAGSSSTLTLSTSADSSADSGSASGSSRARAMVACEVRAKACGLKPTWRNVKSALVTEAREEKVAPPKKNFAPTGHSAHVGRRDLALARAPRHEQHDAQCDSWRAERTLVNGRDGSLRYAQSLSAKSHPPPPPLTR